MIYGVACLEIETVGKLIFSLISEIFKQEILVA